VPYYDAFMCIAEHESGGRWDVATGNGYYGGLQMDIGFQRTYAPGLYRTKGTADHWTTEEQIRAAGRAVASRGFTPWPNTARMCGLL
jgi:resuscitation-promoting factor RpfA